MFDLLMWWILFHYQVNAPPRLILSVEQWSSLKQVTEQRNNGGLPRQRRLKGVCMYRGKAYKAPAYSGITGILPLYAGADLQDVKQ